jgi:multiple sugar transport system substrate-binding protein
MQMKQLSGKQIRRTSATLLTIVMLVAMLAACSGIGSGSKTEETRVLRIATVYGDRYSSGDYLRSEYTDLFEFTHDNIEIEFVSAIDYSTMRYPQTGEDVQKQPDPIEEMAKLMEGPNPPDVVIVDFNQLDDLIGRNLLAPLDSYIADSKFDITGYVPAVIDGLKQAGNGTLYALAPTFTSSALIYNRAIFDEMGVEPPTDGMTWDEVFDLAKRVANGEGQERKFGFSFRTQRYNNLLEDFMVYAAPLKLQMMDDEQEQMLVDSEPWRNTMKKLMELYETDIIPENRDFYQDYTGDYRPGPFEYDFFLSGRLAMAVVQYYQLTEIISANQNAQNIEGFDGIQWDVVTLPVHPEYPNVGGYVEMNPIMAINAKAANPKDAWELIKFINGEDWAELKSRSSSRLLARSDYIKTIDGLDYNVNAFTQLIPAENPMNMNYGRNSELYWAIQNIGQNKFYQLMNSDGADSGYTLEQALAEWQTEGNALLKAVKENPDRNIWELQNEIMMNVSSSASGVKILR